MGTDVRTCSHVYKVKTGVIAAGTQCQNLCFGETILCSVHRSKGTKGYVRKEDTIMIDRSMRRVRRTCKACSVHRIKFIAV